MFAVTQILKAKTEPASNRIMRLLDRLSAYSFNLYYVKGKDMILADYLSRHRVQDNDPGELIPISFCCMSIYNKLIDLDTLHVVTRSSTKTSGQAPPIVHGASKSLNPHAKPEHQNRAPINRPRKPRVISPKRPSHEKIDLQNVSTKTVGLHQRSKSTPVSKNVIDLPKAMFQTPQPSRVAPRSFRPYNVPQRPTLPVPQKQVKHDQDTDYPIHVDTKYTTRKYALDPKPDKGIDTGEAEEILDPEIRIPLDTDFIKPPSLENMIDPTKVIHKFLPKQGEIEKLIKHINRKVLRDTKLTGSLKDLKASYLSSPHFRDIYLFLLQNRAPLNKNAAKRLENNARQYMIMDGLLFKIIDNASEIPDTVLCIPTSKVHILLDFYHSSIMGSHVGITKCYQTISQRFYCPNLAENLRAYITGCHTCQLFKKGKNFQRPFQKRININVPALTKISMDIKQMPSSNGYSHILVLLCEVSNYMVALPLHSIKLNTF